MHARLASGLRACGLNADPANSLATSNEHDTAIRHVFSVFMYTCTMKTMYADEYGGV